jgi:hypothetical protein
MLVAGVFGLTALLPLASAWNRDVHYQIGYLAEQFLTPETASIVSSLLGLNTKVPLEMLQRGLILTGALLKAVIQARGIISIRAMR